MAENRVGGSQGRRNPQQLFRLTMTSITRSLRRGKVCLLWHHQKTNANLYLPLDMSHRTKALLKIIIVGDSK